MTLANFIRKCGSQENAAHKIGVPYNTLNRWICKRVATLREKSLSKLRRVGVTRLS